MSHQRVKRKPRCAGCGLLTASCVCAQLPRVRYSTPIVIIQHDRELAKPTNTGRPFATMAEGTVLITVGQRTFEPGPLLDSSIEWMLVFPRKGAPVLAPDPGKRRGFVVLDGSWSQCSKLSRRLPIVRDLPCVGLPPGPPSFWTVRTQHRAEGRSTFEAALQVIELHEGAEAVQPLRRAFAMLTARMLHLKGKLSSPEVPAEWGV